MVCTQEGLCVWTVENLDVHLIFALSGCKRHLSRAHGDCVDSDIASNVESEPVANVEASVSQPVNVDPPMTVTTHIPVEKR